MKLTIAAWMAFSSSAALAVTMNLPAQTIPAVGGVYNLDGFSPAPTEKPIPRFDLLRRQAAASSNNSQIGYFGPDNTCGYVEGSLGAYKSCTPGFTCGAVNNPDPSKIGTVACCGGGHCTFFGNCVDSASYYSSSACGHACQQDFNTIKCTESTLPFCFIYTVPGINAGFFSCDTTTGIDTLLTTFNGQTSVRTWTPVWDSSSSIIPSPPPSTKTVPQSSTSTGTSIPQSTLPPVIPTSSNSLPIGAIVGGVIGGLAFIALVVTAIVFLCLYHKRKVRNQQPEPDPMSYGGIAVSKS